MKIKNDSTSPRRFHLDTARSNGEIMSTTLSLLLSYPGVWGKSLWLVCMTAGILGTILSFLFHLTEIPPLISQTAGILIAAASAAIMAALTHQILAEASLSEAGRLQPFHFSKNNIKQLSQSSRFPFIVFFLISLLTLTTFYIICSFTSVPDFLLVPALLLAVLLWLPFHLIAYHHLSFLPATMAGMKLVKRKPASQYGHALIIGLCAGTLYLLVAFIISLPLGILHTANLLSEHSVMAGDTSDLPGYVPVLSWLLTFITLAASTFSLLFIILPCHLLSYSLRCRYRQKA